MYETFEHTADLGLRVRADSLEMLLAEAGRGLSSLIVEPLEAVEPRQTRTIEVSGDEREYLLFDWLNELLYLFESEHFVGSQFEVQLTKDGLTATIRGETADPDRHRLEHEVKAITYHGLKVEQADDVWLAELIVDI